MVYFLKGISKIPNHHLGIITSILFGATVWNALAFQQKELSTSWGWRSSKNSKMCVLRRTVCEALNSNPVKSQPSNWFLVQQFKWSSRPPTPRVNQLTISTPCCWDSWGYWRFSSFSPSASMMSKSVTSRWVYPEIFDQKSSAPKKVRPKVLDPSRNSFLCDTAGISIYCTPKAGHGRVQVCVMNFVRWIFSSRTSWTPDRNPIIHIFLHLCPLMEPHTLIHGRLQNACFTRQWPISSLATA